MIKEKDLNVFRDTYRYPNGSTITLQGIQSQLQSCASGYQIPIAFYSDQVKSGGLLNAQAEECLVIHHPAHLNDYYKIVITIKRQGTMAFVATYSYGESKNKNKLSAGSAAGASLKAGWKAAGKEGNWSPGMSLVTGLAGGAFHALKSLGGNKAKQEEEQLYYSALVQILDEVIH